MRIRIIEFIRPSGLYSAGERAGFPEPEAEAFVKAGIGKYWSREKPEVKITVYGETAEGQGKAVDDPRPDPDAAEDWRKLSWWKRVAHIEKVTGRKPKNKAEAEALMADHEAA